MELKELKKKIISEVESLNNADVLEEVLFLLNKDTKGEILDIKKWKEKIFSEDKNLLKRLS